MHTKHKRSHAQVNARSNSKSSKFAFRHSFGREGCARIQRICISPQFWASDDHFLREGLLGNLKKLHFTTVLDFFSLQAAGKKRNFKEEQHFKRSSIFEEQPSKSSSFEQPSSAAFLGSLSQQSFLAAFLSSVFQQPFSAVFFSSISQQPFSALFFSSLSQQPFSAAFLSSVFQQCFSAAFLSSLSQQPFSAAILSHHLAVVRGWWSAIAIILLWSGVGGQLVTSSCCSQGLVVKYAPVL